MANSIFFNNCITYGASTEKNGKYIFVKIVLNYKKNTLESNFYHISQSISMMLHKDRIFSLIDIYLFSLFIDLISSIPRGPS